MEKEDQKEQDTEAGLMLLDMDRQRLYNRLQYDRSMDGEERETVRLMLGIAEKEYSEWKQKMNGNE
jgi:hypothetical protein